MNVFEFYFTPGIDLDIPRAKFCLQNKGRIGKGIHLFFLFFGLTFHVLVLGQSFDGPVGSSDCKAISHDSSIIKSWATIVYETNRGWMNVAKPELGKVSAGEAAFATGPALQNGVVSLGDGGSLVVGFNIPISNGPGPDFAVFENGFSDDFLELAFVAVSSDGVSFYTFSAESVSDTTRQINGFGATDCRKINNLAGKYKVGFGTPFDLQELAGSPNLNLKSITHVRITDVVGTLNSSSTSRDAKGRKINDPYPTAFPTGGFDLDAVGVLNEAAAEALPGLWPNPVTSNAAEFSGTPESELTDLLIITTTGRKVASWKSIPNKTKLKLDLPGGIYYAQFTLSGKKFTQKLLVL